MRKRAPWQLHSSWPTSSRQRSDTVRGMIDTQAHIPSIVERGRAAGIQLGLSCEDLVALGLQPPASLLTAVAVADGQCSSGAQCSDAQLADRAAYSSRARPLHTPLDEETKGDLLLMSMPDPLSRRSRVCWQLGPGCMFGGLDAIRHRFRLGRWRCERLLRK